MQAPINRLSKKEVFWLSKHRCKHKHTFLEHYSCYESLTCVYVPERVAILDIETTGLEADFNYVICYCFKELSGKIVEARLRPRDVHNYTFDKTLISKFINDSKKYDRVITYYGTGFDLPFLRARALKHNLDFPEYGEQYHDDLYYTVKFKLRLHRNSLAAACSLLKIPAKATPITEEMKERAMAGDAKSIAKIIQHCREDVIATEELYKRIFNFARKKSSSI